MTLACSDINTVQRVVLVRSGAVTHGFDMNQRYVQLQFTMIDGSYPDVSLDAQGPPDGYAAPPGYYLLFVIDGNGVPSEGRWVRVG